jgi:hypothetical protein
VSFDTDIDKLYQLPLADFTAARNALAKTLKGEQAATVKRLEKPTLVPWAVNQLYWRERKTFDRLMASGRALRAAQIAALKGKSADLREATAEHREVLAAAVATASQLAADAGAKPQTDALSRMLEALSLAQEAPADAGRLTDLVQPAGFEALAGVTPVAKLSASPAAQGGRSAPSAGETTRRPPGAASKTSAPTAAESAAERRRAERAAAERKAAETAVHASERQLDRARAALARAGSHADAVRQQLERAERDAADARKAVEDAERQLRDHRATLERLC